MSINDVSSKARYSLKSDTWILSCSDLHLAANKTTASEWVEEELSREIKDGGANKRAIVVLNGDIVEIWAGERPNIKKALTTHSLFAKTLLDFSRMPNHKVFYVIGNHDGKVGWDKNSQKAVKELLGAELCFELELSSPQGSIFFEHGNAFDPDNSFEDPRDPYDKPFGQYIVQQALPLVKQSQGKMLAGIDHLAEPHQFPKFVASRVMYREILNRSWWLLIPLLITLLGRIIIGLGVYKFSGFPAQRIAEILILTELAVLINIMFLVGVIALILQAILKKAKGLPGAGSGAHHNDAPRTRASEEIQKGNLGVITGHTHRPEVTKIGQGFYANSGSGTKMIMATKAKFGLPKTYIAKNQLSWVELYYGKKLEVNLHSGLRVVGEQTRLEKSMTRNKHSEQPLQIHKQISIEL